MASLWYYGLRGAALLYLPAAFGVELFGLPVFAVFYDLDWIATVPPTVPLTTDPVGPADGAIVVGWIVPAHQIGAGLGALGAGVVRTELSTYTPAWVTAGLISMVAAVMVLGIGAVRAASPRPYGPTNATPSPPSNRGGRAVAAERPGAYRCFLRSAAHRTTATSQFRWSAGGNGSDLETTRLVSALSNAAAKITARLTELMAIVMIH
jgi:hypothetical protein